MLRSIANGVATLTALPFFVGYRILTLLEGKNRSFAFWCEMLSLAPGSLGILVRRAFFRLTFGRCADTVTVGFGTVFSSPACQLGQHVYIGPFGSIGAVDIEDDVLIGSHVSIPNGSRQHGIERMDIPVRLQPGTWERITVGTDSWIGDRAVLMSNVGRHCVVGAGAVVTKPVDDFSIVAGCPAKVIGFRGSKAAPLENEQSECVE